MPGTPRTQITSLSVLAKAEFSQPGASSQAAQDSILQLDLLSELGQPGSASPTPPVARSSLDTSQESQSCPTCGRSTTASGARTCCTEATPVSPSPRLDSEAASMTLAISGPNSPVAFAFYDHASSCWRMSQGTLFLDSSASSLILPRWGMTRAGDAYELPMWGRLIDGNDCSPLPTPTAQDARNNFSPSQQRRNSDPLHIAAAKILPTPGANDATGGGREESRGGGPGLRGVAELLPTPTVGDSKSAVNQTCVRYNPDSQHQDGTTLTDATRLLSGVSTSQQSDAGKASSGAQHPGQLTIEDV